MGPGSALLSLKHAKGTEQPAEHNAEAHRHPAYRRRGLGRTPTASRQNLRCGPCHRGGCPCQCGGRCHQRQGRLVHLLGLERATSCPPGRPGHLRHLRWGRQLGHAGCLRQVGEANNEIGNQRTAQARGLTSRMQLPLPLTLPHKEGGRPRVNPCQLPSAG